MDGNRRFAESFGLSPKAGHLFGRDKIEDVLDWCFELGINVLTVYAFSTENFNRSSDEVTTLMSLCKQELEKAAKDSRIHKNKVKVRVIGDIPSFESRRGVGHAVDDETVQAVACPSVIAAKRLENHQRNTELARPVRRPLETKIESRTPRGDHPIDHPCAIRPNRSRVRGSDPQGWY